MGDRSNLWLPEMRRNCMKMVRTHKLQAVRQQALEMGVRMRTTAHTPQDIQASFKSVNPEFSSQGEKFF